MAHAHKSPSKAARLHACPGFLALVESLPKSMRGKAGAAAEKGTAAHALLERCLQRGESAESYEGRFIALLKKGGTSILRPGCVAGGESSYEVDSYMIRGVEMAREYALKRCEELHVKSSELLLEAKTNPLPERNDCYGTADITLDAWPDLLEVIDYKNGVITVDHADNPQLLAYLLGMAHATGWDHARYQITVVQPNARHEEGEARSQSVTKEKLREFEARHRAACIAADEASAEFQDTAEWANKWLCAGDHCGFCDAAGVCRARFALTQKQLEVEFDREPESMPVKEALGRAVQLLKWCKQIEGHLKAAEEFVKSALGEGQKHPGVTLEKDLSHRKWLPDVAPDIIVNTMIKEGFIQDGSKMYTEPELITGPQAEKLIPAKRRKEFSDKFLRRFETGVKVVFTKSEKE